MSPTVGAMIFCGLALAAFVWHENTPDRIRQKNAEAVAAAKDYEPRFYKSSGDGCRVYRFKESSSGRWIYFTRCEGDRTSTRTTWQECRLVGKVTVCSDESQTVESIPKEQQK